MKHFLLASIIGAAALLISCSDAETNTDNAPTKYRVIEPLIIDTTTVTDYVCDIHSINNVEIRSRVKGFIEAIFVDEGHFVKKGQLLFKIGSQEFTEELLKAKAAHKSAIAEAKTVEIDLKNAELLAEKGIISKTELEMISAKLEAAKAKVEEAQSHEFSAKLKLSYCEIKAPFDGFIDRIPNKTGSLLDEGSLVTTLSDNYEVFAYFNVSEKEYLNYMNMKKIEPQNDVVKLILANNELYEQEGKIETVDGQFDIATGTIAFRARFSNTEKLLKHGASGKIRLTNKIKNATIIPQKTTFEVQDKVFIYVVTKDNTIEIRNITIKNKLAHLYIIESGVETE